MRHKLILLDDRHVRFLIPTSLPRPQVNRISRLLLSRRLELELRKAVRAVLHRFEALAPVRVRIN